jgi:glycogen phosphorylase
MLPSGASVPPCGNAQELWPSMIDVMPLIDPPGLDAASLRQDLLRHFAHSLGRDNFESSPQYIYTAFALTIRDRLTAGWNATRHAHETAESGRVCYLSMEFLLGRLMHNALLNLANVDEATAALDELGLSLHDVEQCEHDAGLGNGGLGRLAACFLDSAATLGLPVIGYGLRYRYGMFRQRLENGQQVEEPDVWLRDGYPWELERSEFMQRVQFGGRSEMYCGADGRARSRWVDTQDVLAVPYDIPVPGYKNGVVNTLRLWSAQATDEFDLTEFNAGSYSEAVRAKNAAENVTMVLYPNDISENGKELRLRQQYFLVSASLKDCIRHWVGRAGRTFEQFAEQHCFQLNDTHPSLTVAELMRLLLDEHDLEWDEAWAITSKTIAYTNHTLLPEALERWPVRMLESFLPRLLEIVYEINGRFLGQVAQNWPGDVERQSRMSIIEEGREPMVRMAHLAVVASFSVNGVAELHSRLLREGLFRDFYEMWPKRFNNKTNGVTPRRWLTACNGPLGQLISDTVDDDWTRDLGALAGLERHADEASFQSKWRAIKTANKTKLAELVYDDTGVEFDPTTQMFDVQVKRIHEYKRQLLNILHVVHLYRCIKDGDVAGMVPRAVLFAGKAAPGYAMAKCIIKLINNVAKVVNEDPDTQGWLRVAFLPDFRISAMEVIAPAVDVSEQISTAGNEASGTGNMKLMMNGAVTIGTRDGANVEILEAVGEDNFFVFGMTAEDVRQARVDGHEPSDVIADDADLARVMALLHSGHFNQMEPGVHEDVLDSISDSNDQWMTAADFPAYVRAQEQVSAAYADHQRWSRMSILNTAASGRFSSDRTIAQYNEDIWKVRPLKTGA